MCQSKRSNAILRVQWVCCAIGLIGCGTSVVAQPALFGVGSMIGDYRVERRLSTSVQFIDLEYAEGQLYALENYDGIVHRIDLETGEATQHLWVQGWMWSPPDAQPGDPPVDTLHDHWPFDYPAGLVIDGDMAFMASRDPNSIRVLSMEGPTSEQHPTAHSYIYALYSDRPLSLAYGEGIFYYSYYDRIGRLDRETGLRLESLPSPYSSIYALTFDGENLLALYGLSEIDRFFAVISPTDGTVLSEHRFLAERSFWGLTYDAASETLYAGNTNGDIWVARRVPEASTLTLLATGLVLVGARRRRDCHKSAHALPCVGRSRTACPGPQSGQSRRQATAVVALGVIAVLLGASVPCSVASGLLGDIHYEQTVNYSDYPYAPEPVTFGLRWGWPWPTPRMWSDWWYNGDSGTIDFTAESHDVFAIIAAGITNGEDDFLDVLWSRNPLSGYAAYSIYESEWELGAPDLQGATIDLIRLEVDRFIAIPGLLDFSFSWEFWGTPEPTAALFMLAGMIPLFGRRPVHVKAPRESAFA